MGNFIWSNSITWQCFSLAFSPADQGLEGVASGYWTRSVKPVSGFISHCSSTLPPYARHSPK